MSKTEATILEAENLTAEQTEQINDLQESVQHLIEKEVEAEKIQAAYDELITVCFDLRQYDTAMDGLNYIREHSSELDLNDTQTAALHRRFGVAAFAKEEFDEAKIEFDKGIALAANDIDIELEGKLLCDLGNIAAVKEEFSEAIELYEAAIEKNEAHEIQQTAPYINLGLIYLKVQNISEAAECFEAALEIFDEEEELDRQEILHLQLGRIYDALNNDKDALLNYHYASELQEEGSEILGETYVLMAGVLLGMAENGKAIEYYEKALPIVLEHGDIELKAEHYFQLANLYSRYDEDYETAIQYFENALEIAKTDEENEEWRNLMVAKLEDSIEVNQENLSKFSKRKSKKSGLFGRLFGN
ncbi:MAG: tetratricopeptide (TPR) repeat protein [Saprospiraceae bacterium]|jgi:tetratricopeptide (TPR) repeat protein